MNKKIIAVILSAAAALSSFSFAAADDDKVEIAFKVGDSILSINGADTEVETPYVAGEGVTLVPLRVITEAFGAQVDWEGETKAITLTYPDVNIMLQIGNIIATVNDHSETLLEAPALSENGVTMVPLRFISETFGATVGYDSDTQAILVTKEKVGDAQTVTGITDLSRTGDSYYAWSIATPTAMKMTDRRLDGLSTTFTADDDSRLYIDVYANTKDDITPFDEEYSKVKDSFSSYTLTEAEKLTDEKGKQYMHFQAKDKEQTIDYREYYGNNYRTYEVVSVIQNNDDTSTKDMILSIANSFKLESFTKDTYDLSNVTEDGMRAIKDDKYKVSFKVPANYRQSLDSETENEFMFYSQNPDSNAYVALEIYSKSDEVTAHLLAQKDHDRRVDVMNPEFSTISDIVNNDGIYRYTHEIKGSSSDDAYTTDSFFERGDYVYNLAVTVDSLEDSSLAGTIIASLETETLDRAIIGKLLRNDPEYTTMSERTVGDYSFDLSAAWKTVSSGQGIGQDMYSGIFMDMSTGSGLTMMVTKGDDYKKGDASSLANNFIKYLKNSKQNSDFSDVKVENINKNRYSHFTYKVTSDEGDVSYATVYIRPDAKEMVMISLLEKDIYYHKDGNSTLLNVIDTLNKK